MIVTLGQQYNIGVKITVILYYYLVPAPSETWFRGMSVGGSFRRV